MEGEMGEVIEETGLAISCTLLMLNNEGSLYFSDTCKGAGNFLKWKHCSIFLSYENNMGITEKNPKDREAYNEKQQSCLPPSHSPTLQR